MMLHEGVRSGRRHRLDPVRLYGIMIETRIRPVSVRKFHEIWIEQCDAAQNIKLRYGLKAAFDYVVAEKLLNFASAAADHPEFARELPRFVSRVRGMFTPQEIQTHLARIEQEERERSIMEPIQPDSVI
jgi:hypothetical protein